MSQWIFNRGTICPLYTFVWLSELYQLAMTQMTEEAYLPGNTVTASFISEHSAGAEKKKRTRKGTKPCLYPSQ